MCHSRENNNKINRLHERCLRIIYNDKYTDLPDLDSFEVALRKWRPANCPCRICKVYIVNVGFV